ncbi:MAG: hypothetical protein J1E02_00360 [Coprobacter sp.]|nr:hypothetical protein [Coprobacter sp.]
MKYISMLLGGLLLGSSFAGCVDDNIGEPGMGDDSIYAIAEDEYAMGITLSLNQLSGGSTRAALGDIGVNGLKDIEEYVNTENLYILFFNLDGTFLFQIPKPTAIPIGQSANGNDNQWFIKIPVKTINKNLIHYIEENPFKIAVLANWTYDADVNTGGNWDAFEFHEPVDADGNLTVDESGKLLGDHISLLSHAQLDNVYENLAVRGYDHLVYRTETGPHMGPYTEWVSNYHRNIAEAEQDIRYNYNVTENTYNNPESKRPSNAINHFDVKYRKLWQVWYFNGTYDGTGKQDFGVEAGDDQKKEWIRLNQEARVEMMKDEYGEDFGYNHSHTYRMKGYDDLYLSQYVGLNYWDTEARTAEPDPDVNADEKMKFSAVSLSFENISMADNDNGMPLNLSESDDLEHHPFIRFTAHADGYVRIKFKSHHGAKLYAHVGQNNTPENDASGYQKDNQKCRFEIDPTTNTFSTGEIADVPFEPKPIYLYMVKDPDAQRDENDKLGLPCIDIYSIEYIESRHLYDVDRRGILPTKDYPIPMYGIQDFDPIGEYWEPGLLFNLSQFNNAQKQGYSYRNVSLLRSLSRVEVKLLKSAFPKKPAHVFLRSMNRSARITPVDFFTPTDIIWNGFNPSSMSDVKRLQNYIAAGNLNEQHIIENTPGIKGEIDNIMQYGPVYIGTDGNKGDSDMQKLNEYRKTTAWPFGIWERQWGWDWNRGTAYVDYFDTYQVGQTRAHTGQTVPEYPRILHTRISRSDYARFTEVEDQDYWHYIMYIPEKNITDADNPGDISDRPKIIHVELRFNGGRPEKDNAEDNMVDNFDDNAAYRLYFTEGGRANLGSFDFTGRESWDKYEYDLDIVKQHWPIMRNHEYIFTVNGSFNNRGNIDFQVNAPDQRTVNWEFN